MAETTEEFRHHIKKYLNVFYGLLVLTVITVAVAYVHLTIPLAILVALAIAVFKSSLVAGFFMHLIGEKKIIIYTLLLTVVLLAVLMALPVLTGGTSPYKQVAPVSLAESHDDHGGTAEGREGGAH